MPAAQENAMLNQIHLLQSNIDSNNAEINRIDKKIQINEAKLNGAPPEQIDAMTD